MGAGLREERGGEEEEEEGKCPAEELGQHSYITSCFCIWQWSWRAETEREKETEDVAASSRVACSLAYTPGYRPAQDITVKDNTICLSPPTAEQTKAMRQGQQSIVWTLSVSVATL